MHLKLNNLSVNNVNLVEVLLSSTVKFYLKSQERNDRSMISLAQACLQLTNFNIPGPVLCCLWIYSKFSVELKLLRNVLAFSFDNAIKK